MGNVVQLRPQAMLEPRRLPEPELEPELEDQGSPGDPWGVLLIAACLIGAAVAVALSMCVALWPDERAQVVHQAPADQAGDQGEHGAHRKPEPAQ